jgi:hypothetical protein
VPPEAAFAPFEELAQDGLASVAKSAEFLFRLVPPEAAFGPLRNSRKTDSLLAAKSAEFLFRLVPPEAAFALLSYCAQRNPMFGVRCVGRTQLRKNTVILRGESDHAPPRITL